MTTINNMEDLIRILEERPKWRAAARSLIVGEELAQLPGRVTKLEESLAAFIQATDRNFQLVHQRLERLEEGQARLEPIRRECPGNSESSSAATSKERLPAWRPGTSGGYSASARLR